MDALGGALLGIGGVALGGILTAVGAWVNEVSRDGRSAKRDSRRELVALVDGALVTIKSAEMLIFLRDIRAQAVLKGDSADAFLELDDATNAAVRELGVAQFRLKIMAPERPDLSAAVGRCSDTYIKHRDLVNAAVEKRGSSEDVARHRGLVEKATADFIEVAGTSLQGARTAVPARSVPPSDAAEGSRQAPI